LNLRCFVLAIVLAGASSAGAQTPTYDLVIRGGRIVDGTGAPSYRADLAVLNGRISVIGRPDTTKARRVIDATGLVVAPGFIDMMGQSADMFTRGPADVAINLLSRGITTLNAARANRPRRSHQERLARWVGAQCASIFGDSRSQGLRSTSRRPWGTPRSVRS